MAKRVDAKVETKGDQNQVFISGRDTIIRQSEAEEFLRIKAMTLDPSPKNTEELVTLLKTERLLVLGGSPPIDKLRLAEHLAYILQMELSPPEPEEENGDDDTGGDASAKEIEDNDQEQTNGSSDQDNKQTETRDSQDATGKSGSKSESEAGSDSVEDSDNDSKDNHEEKEVEETESEDAEDSEKEMPKTPTLPVWQWSPGANPKNPMTALQKKDAPAIIILPDLLPQHINHQSLDKIKDRIAEAQHYAIVTTDKPVESWHLDPEGEHRFWSEIPEPIYSPLELYTVLIKKLKQAQYQENLPGSIQTSEFGPRNTLVGWPFYKIATLLKTPDNIDRFIDLLCKEKRQLTGPIVKELVHQAQDTVWQWYPYLEPRKQLLALGLSLFDGLFEDQFFSAMEQVVELKWQRRDSSLRGLDHCDLEELSSFFHLVETNEGEIIRSRLSGQRPMLFEQAWRKHRRQILSAMPVVIDIIQNSAVVPPLDMELYGTPERRDRLRRVVSNTLGEIALNSPKAIKDVLIEFAADEHTEVQKVAARAMARLYDSPKKDDALKILEDWEKDTGILDIFRAILEGRSLTKSTGPRAYIRATIALTLSHIAQNYTPPNQLPDKLCDLIGQLATDDNEFVRERFTQETLPTIIPIHLEQLYHQEILNDLVRYLALIPAVSDSLALAYQHEARLVYNIISAWRTEASANRPVRIDEEVITIYDAWLATVALTLGSINYDSQYSVINARRAFGQLRDLLEKEKHSFVRRALVVGITLLAGTHFDEVEAPLKPLVEKVTASEQREIVNTLTQVYLDQRERLEGGDTVITVNNRKYQVWMEEKNRPLTEIEMAMYQWMRDPLHTAAQQLATLAWISFARALDKEEDEYREKIRRAQEEEDEEKKETPEPKLVKIPKHGLFIDQLIPWIVTLRQRDYHAVVQGLLPEALVQHRSGRDIMDFVLEKWEKQAPNDEVKLIAKLLTRAIHMAERRRQIYASLAGAAVIIGLGLILLQYFG